MAGCSKVEDKSVTLNIANEGRSAIKFKLKSSNRDCIIKNIELNEKFTGKLFSNSEVKFKYAGYDFRIYFAGDGGEIRGYKGDKELPLNASQFMQGLVQIAEGC